MQKSKKQTIWIILPILAMMAGIICWLFFRPTPPTGEWEKLVDQQLEIFESKLADEVDEALYPVRQLFVKAFNNTDKFATEVSEFIFDFRSQPEVEAEIKRKFRSEVFDPRQLQVDTNWTFEKYFEAMVKNERELLTELNQRLNQATGNPDLDPIDLQTYRNMLAEQIKKINKDIQDRTWLGRATVAAEYYLKNRLGEILPSPRPGGGTLLQILLGELLDFLTKHLMNILKSFQKEGLKEEIKKNLNGSLRQMQKDILEGPKGNDGLISELEKIRANRVKELRKMLKER